MARHIGMLARLVWYDTTRDNKYAADYRHEYIGDMDDIFRLYLLFTDTLKHRHVEVYGLDGTRQEPERGRSGMSGYNV